MENWIRLAEAMGFWGWCSLTSITAILCFTVYQFKKLQLKAHGLLKDNSSEDAAPCSPDKQGTSWPEAFSEAAMWLSIPLMFLAIGLIN